MWPQLGNWRLNCYRPVYFSGDSPDFNICHSFLLASFVCFVDFVDFVWDSSAQATSNLVLTPGNIKERTRSSCIWSSLSSRLKPFPSFFVGLFWSLLIYLENSPVIHQFPVIVLGALHCVLLFLISGSKEKTWSAEMGKR